MNLVSYKEQNLLSYKISFNSNFETKELETIQKKVQHLRLTSVRKIVLVLNDV